MKVRSNLTRKTLSFVTAATPGFILAFSAPLAFAVRATSVAGQTGSDGIHTSVAGQTGSDAIRTSVAGQTGSDAIHTSVAGQTGSDAIHTSVAGQTGSDAIHTSVAGQAFEALRSLDFQSETERREQRSF
jgi:hypothetical protein